MKTTRRDWAFAFALTLLPCAQTRAQAQCLLANPSFEIEAAGSAAFEGWNQFGSVGVSSEALHGHRAALVRGPDLGGWDVSGFWQRLDCSDGESWEVRGHVRHPATEPLLGANVALVNVEWRDASENLISYESHTVADAQSPTEEYLDFDIASAAAPAGTASLRLLVGVLQSPGDPPSATIFDQITLRSSSAPVEEEIQWADFSGGASVDFAGRSWRIKGPGIHGPGGNDFCDDPDCVWVDAQGRLHLTLQERAGPWSSTEVALEESLGYGDYVVTTSSDLDALDPYAVLGLFLWTYRRCWDPADAWWNPDDEFDIEYGRWGDPQRDIGQFVAQPWDRSGNLHSFDASFSEGPLVSHAMRWLPDRLELRVWEGGPEDESPASLLETWTYEGPDIPRPESPRLHLNLWKLAGTPAQDQEIVFEDFSFVPAPENTVITAADRLPTMQVAATLHSLFPNPFNPATQIRFDVHRAGRLRLDVYDVRGRHVRTLARGAFEAGEHQRTWRGRDGQGRTVASGVYLIRLSGEDFVETRRGVLLE